ncbi:9499f0a5-8a90-47a8-93d7-4df2a5ec5e20 [Thermothielavioides terrestris]|uniref:9499f0a5-8a90-47a8-93d7-4df2a5ec5e20 n=1 Tax=Thermothielavioides terrestris TaxID=2587410 RepID=A0A3S4D485_9PEZI|nr:9499f0a5-8a90-47a8-93d7-4df2a5ec5e20 [Thermothielavioides terrestris]
MLNLVPLSVSWRPFFSNCDQMSGYSALAHASNCSFLSLPGSALYVTPSLPGAKGQPKLADDLLEVAAAGQGAAVGGEHLGRHVEVEALHLLPDAAGGAVAVGQALAGPEDDLEAAVGGALGRVGDVAPEVDGRVGLVAGRVGQHQPVVQPRVQLEGRVHLEHVVDHAQRLRVRVGAEPLKAAHVHVRRGPLRRAVLRPHVAEDEAGHVRAAAGEEGVHQADALGRLRLREELAQQRVAVPHARRADPPVEAVLDEGAPHLRALLQAVRDGVQRERVDHVVLVVVAQEHHAECHHRLRLERRVAVLQVGRDVEDAAEVGFRDGAERPEVLVEDGQVLVLAHVDFALQQLVVDGLDSAEVFGVQAVVHLEDLGAQREEPLGEVGVLLLDGGLDEGVDGGRVRTSTAHWNTTSHHSFGGFELISCSKMGCSHCCSPFRIANRTAAMYALGLRIRLAWIGFSNQCFVSSTRSRDAKKVLLAAFLGEAAQHQGPKHLHPGGHLLFPIQLGSELGEPFGGLQ